jgi:metallo-beta-lactamase class B
MIIDRDHRPMPLRRLPLAASAIVLASMLAGAAAAIAQTASPAPPAGLPTREDFARDTNLFITFARRGLKWDEPTEPSRIVGPLHYVGTHGLAAYLFATPEGHILMNTGMPGSAAMITSSMQKLGFRPEDIKIVIIAHAHIDHAGDIAVFQRYGAKLAVMEGDVAPMQDGGKSDFHYGADWRVMGFPETRVDRILRNGDTVALGEVVLTAHATPGHTRGATTWSTILVDSGRAHRVVFPDGFGVNPGYRLTPPTSYPGIDADYRRTHHFLEMLRPDIWLSHHTEAFGFHDKRARATTEGVRAWLDPEGYRRAIAGTKRAFEDLVDAEIGASPAPRP